MSHIKEFRLQKLYGHNLSEENSKILDDNLYLHNLTK